MDLKKLSRGEMIIGISGVLLLIFSFFKWYDVSVGTFKIGEVEVGGGSVYSSNGWGRPSAILSILAIILGVVMAAHVIADKLAGIEMPDRLGSVGWSVFYLAGGVLAFVFLIIKFLSNTDYVQFWFYLAILCSLGLAIGGFLTSKERGELDQVMKRNSGGGSTPPAPPA